MFFSEVTAKEVLQKTKRRVTEYQTELIDRLTAIEVDAHWFRRVFHTFAASFLIYYVVPDEGWLFGIKRGILLGALLVLFIVEYHRIHGDLSEKVRFFGLRSYEQQRPASYLYFGIGVVLLFLFFPQQIVIPCVLCVAFIDPLMGEIRYYYGKQNAVLIGLLVSALLFGITWFQAEWWILSLVAVVGGVAVVVGETQKVQMVDDDLLIQMLPAMLLVILWQGFLWAGVDILPEPMILPL